MESTNINPGPDELLQLREGLNALVEKLSTQRIISEKLLRQVMAGDGSWNNRFFKFEIFLMIPFCVLLFVAAGYFLGVSWFFVGFTCVMFVIDAIWDSQIIRLPRSAYATMPLVELQKKVLSQIRGRKIQLIVEMPLLFLWTMWFAYELVVRDNIFSDLPFWLMFIPTLLGFGAGALVVVKIYKKLDENSRSVLERLESFLRS